MLNPNLNLEALKLVQSDPLQFSMKDSRDGKRKFRHDASVTEACRIRFGSVEDIYYPIFAVGTDRTVLVPPIPMLSCCGKY